jgi:acyl carrier protein
MTPRSWEQVLQDLANLLRDFNGKEYSGEIGAKTLFFSDLGMVSIDAVILAETLERVYNRSFPFSEFLSEVGRGGRDIKLGELAAFLHGHMIGSGWRSERCQ